MRGITKSLIWEKKHFLILGILLGILLVIVLRVIFEAQTASKQQPVISSQTTTTLISVETTTTIEEIIEVPVVMTTTVPVVTTTTVHIHTTKVPSTTIVRAPLVETVNSGGPPRNTTTLVGCIAYYESTWGEDPNVFQFTQGTWRAYGGTGSASSAPYSEQLTVFWAAWEDDGKHHWAAQKGRCF
jgi:hypothetical protein